MKAYYIAEMPSYTYAVKAARLLKARAFPCDIIRRESGCGYDIRFYNAAAFAVLDKYAVPYAAKSNGGAS